MPIFERKVSTQVAHDVLRLSQEGQRGEKAKAKVIADAASQYKMVREMVSPGDTVLMKCLGEQGKVLDDQTQEMIVSSFNGERKFIYFSGTSPMSVNQFCLRFVEVVARAPEGWWPHSNTNMNNIMKDYPTLRKKPGRR